MNKFKDITFKAFQKMLIEKGATPSQSVSATARVLFQIMTTDFDNDDYRLKLESLIHDVEEERKEAAKKSAEASAELEEVKKKLHILYTKEKELEKREAAIKERDGMIDDLNRYETAQGRDMVRNLALLMRFREDCGDSPELFFKAVVQLLTFGRGVSE